MRNYIILSIAFAIILTGCSKIDQGTIETGDCLVSFNLTGEITTKDTPLTRSSTDDIYLVQVYRGNNSPFASGIYDNLENMKLFLKQGGDKYKIQITLMKNIKGKLQSLNSYSYNNSYLYSSGAIFTFRSQPSIISMSNSSDEYFLVNQTCYNSVGSYQYYRRNNFSVIYNGSRQNMELSLISRGQLEEEKYFQCDDLLFGEINNYSPKGDTELLNIELKRVGFKLKYEVSGITDGEVSVRIYNNDRTFVADTLSSEGGPHSIEPRFYAYLDMRSAWQYADDYMENFTLAVSWLRGIGVTEDYGTKTIQLKRNCLNNVRISMTSNDKTAGMNLDVESEDSIGADQYVIPVQ